MYPSPTPTNPTRKKFSFFRLVQNAFPVFANDDPNDVDPSPQQKDYLFRYQMHQPSPHLLGEYSFFIGGVVGSKQNSPAVYRALKKNGVLSETGEIRTERITRDFANQVRTVSVHAQRKLVGLLFWWEEEVVRLRLVGEEEKEVEEVLEELTRRGDGNNAVGREVKMLLEGVRRRKALLPSERVEDKLPDYEG
ncbi:MAG: hypothetical protein M1835_003538 [Candelina submexicana]|nr:MAG: hypothetical protein M1835_003538 [Candelina submexicana]